MKKISMIAALVGILLSFAASTGYANSTPPVAQKGQRVDRGYIVVSAEPTAGGARLIVEIFHAQKSAGVTLTLQALIDSGSGSSYLVDLRTLSDNVNDNPNSYYSRREFLLNYDQMNKFFKENAPRAKDLRVGFAAIVFLSGSLAHAGHCGDAFDSASSWRRDATRASFAVPTSAEREVRLKAEFDKMVDMISNDGMTPTMRIDFAEGEVRVLEYPGNCGTGLCGRYELKNLGPEGKARFTLLLPVSAHTGWENAQKWAKTDTYSIYAGQTPIVQNAASMGLVTAQEIEVTLQKGQTLEISYHRSGSLGPSGFREGRVMYLTWDGS